MKNIAIIGTGLIGGSLAKALHGKHNLFSISQEINDTNIFKKQTKISDLTEVLSILQNSDFIFITTPISEYSKILKIIQKDENYEKKIIAEFGSVKEYPNSLRKKYKMKNLNLTHPIAGSEKSGFANSFGELFKNKTIILDKKNKHNHELINVLSDLNVKNFSNLSAKKHDKIYAKTSHFPQVLSFILIDFIEHFNLGQNVTEFIDKFQTFKAFLRISNSNKNLWLGQFGIANLNSENIEENYIKYVKFLSKKKIANFSNFLLATRDFLDQNTQKYQNYRGTGISGMIALSDEILSEISRILIKKDVINFLKQVNIHKYVKNE